MKSLGTVERECQCKNSFPMQHQIKKYWYCLICEKKIGGKVV